MRVAVTLALLVACRHEREEARAKKRVDPTRMPVHDAARSRAEKLTTECDGGAMGACYNLARIYRSGDGVVRDKTKAAALDERACSGKFAPACYSLALDYAKRAGAGDLQHAGQLYTQACNLDFMPGCFNLAVAHRDGTGVAKDLVRAAQLSRRACDGGDGRACYNLAVAHRHGWGVAIDHAELIRIMTRGCEADRLGCSWTSPTEGGLLEDSSCDNRAELCSRLAFEYSAGKIVRKDPKRAKQLYAKACAGGFADACGK